MSIKQKIIGFVGRHRLLAFSLFIALLLPVITNAAGDVKIRMIRDGQPYLYNKVTKKNATANRMLGLNGEIYYCVSKGLKGPDYLTNKGGYGTFSSPVEMSDLSEKILLLGYPNKRLSGFSDIEQYHITQNAFWATVLNYDMVNAPNMIHSVLGNLEATKSVGGKARNEQILQEVKTLFNKALATNISTFTPSLSLAGPNRAALQNYNLVAGPFVITGKNIQKANFNVSASGANGIRFYNDKNQTITNVALGQRFYVSFPKVGNNAIGKMTISLKGNKSHLDGLIYQAPSDKMQDMATLITVTTPAILTTVVSWETVASGQVEISKIDISSSKALAGATIEIYNSAGQKVYSAVSNSQGKILSPALMAGRYTFKETAAPFGYKLNSTVSSFEIKNDGEIIKVKLANEPIPDTPIRIKKVDAKTKAVLRGAKIEVYNSSNVRMFSGTTDANGMAEVGKLKAGNYTYKEVGQPAGYHHNTKVYNFTIKPGESLKVLSIENTAIKKIMVCDLTVRAMITIDETAFDKTKHSKNLDDCTKIDVCDLTNRKPVSIIKTSFDPKKHSNNWDDCTEIKVCDLKTRAAITIIKTAFDKTKHSKNLDDCTKIDVCDLTNRKPVSIIKTSFDPKKHSNNWDDCTEIKVCDLTTKTIIAIVESAFDPSRHSRNQEDCNAKIEVCELLTKNIITIDETKFDGVKYSNNLEDCIPKIEVCDFNTKKVIIIKEVDFDGTKYSKDTADCVSTPPELPKTGPLETAAALIAITAVSLSVAYWYKSAQVVKQIKR